MDDVLLDWGGASPPQVPSALEFLVISGFRGRGLVQLKGVIKLLLGKASKFFTSKSTFK